MSPSPAVSGDTVGAVSARRSVLLRTFGLSLAVAFALLAGVVIFGASAEAATYTLTSTAPSFNWSDPTKWSGGPAGTYPGQSMTNDTVNMTLGGGYTINVDVGLNPLTLLMSCSSCSIVIPAGGTMTVEGSSTISSGGLSLNGGNLALNTGSLAVPNGATLTINSGILDNNGTINVGLGGVFNMNGGQIHGAGTTNVAAGGSPGQVNFTGSNGNMIVDDQDFASGGTVNYSSSTNTLTLQNGVVLTISGGNFNITTDAAINASGGAVIDLNSGQLNKNGGAGTIDIAAQVDNGSLINVTNGAMRLNGGGSHAGTFIMGTSAANTIELNGSHTFSAGSWSGSAAMILASGTATISGPVNATRFTMNGGTVTGAGTLAVSNTFNWNAGSMSGGGGKVQVQSTGNLNGGGGSMQLQNFELEILNPAIFNFASSTNALMVGTGGLIDNSGSWQYTPSSTGSQLLLLGGGQFNNNAGAFFTFNNDFHIGGGSSGLFVNNGSVQKTTASGTSQIYPAFNNLANVSIFASTAVFDFVGGGSHTGTFTTGTGATIQFSSATNIFTGTPSFTGTGNVKLAGGTMQVDVPMSINLPFHQTAGAITGNGNLTLSNFTWSGGDMTNGPGQTILGTNATFNGTTAPMVITNRVVQNNGTLVYSPSGPNYLSINRAGKLTNNSVMNVTVDGPINSDGLSTPKLENLATLNKNTATGSLTLNVPLLNAGTMNINAGKIVVNGGGINAGGISMATNGNSLEVVNGTFFLNAGTVISTVGKIVVNGGTLNLGAATTIENVDLLGGTITGADLTIGNIMNWRAGTLLGPGQVNIGSGNTLDATSMTALGILDNRTISVSTGGQFTHDPATTSRLELRNGAAINVDGIFEIQNSGNILAGTGGGSITVSGTGVLRKSVNGGGTRFDVPVNLTGSGTIQSEISGGTIIFNAGGAMSGGTLNAFNGALIDVFNGTFNITGGSETGPGRLRVLNTGVINVTANVTMQDLEVSGGTLTVVGPSILTTSKLEWFGGTINGNGSTDITTNGQIGSNNALTLTGGHKLRNFGTTDYLASSVNFLTIGSLSSLRNEVNGTFNITTATTIGSTGGAVINSGTFQKITDPGIARINASFTNGGTGSLDVVAGTLILAGGGSSATAVNNGGTLQFDGGTFAFLAGTTYSGSGTLSITNGALQADVNLTASTLNLSGGFLNGSGVVTVNGGTWSGGGMGGTGTTQIGSTANYAVNGSTAKSFSRTMINDGVVTQSTTTSGQITASGTAAFTNNGTWEMQNDAAIGGTGTFTNAAAGTLRKTGTPMSNMSIVLNNAGTTEAQGNPPLNGAFNILGGGTHTGTFTPGNSRFNFAGNHNFNGTTISGPESVIFSSGTSTITGTYNIGGSTSTGSTAVVTFNTNATMGGLTLNNSSTVNGTGAITVTGTTASAWNGGTIAGTGTLTYSGGNLNIGGPTGPITIDGRPVVLNGTTNYSSPTNQLSLVNGASITNGGTFSMNTATPFNGTAGTSFINNGTFTKSGGAGTTVFGPAFSNSSTANFNSGTLNFTGGYTQTAGTTTLGAGSFSTTGSAVFNGGFLAGSGSIGGGLQNNAAIIKPGGPGAAGQLAFSGPMAFNGGTVEIEIGGGTPGTQYDRIAGSSSATLGGNLNVTLIGGFTPANGNTFDVVTFTSSSGTFTESLPTFPGGGSFTSTTNPTEHRLTAIVTSADIAVSQTTSGPAAQGQNVVFTVTVSNNGGSPASSVTLNDTFSNAAFVSVTTTVGSCSGTGPVNCTFGNLAPAATAVVTLTLNANTVGTITNNASAATTTFDANTANNNSSASITVGAAADLALGITDAPDPVNVGANTTYNVTLTNNGPGAASGTTVNLTLAGGTIVSATSSLGCTTTATTVSCSSVAAFGPGTATITVTAQAGSGTSMTLSGSASSGTPDLVPANNSASQTTTISPVADLAITKTGGAAARPNTSVVYTITITNSGPSDATNVVVSDPTPARMQWVSNSGNCTTAFPCNLGTIPTGQSRTIMARFEVTSGGQTPIVNTASVTAATADPNTANNSASATTDTNCSSVAPSNLQPTDGSLGIPASGVLRWEHANATSYNVFLGPVGSGCSSSTPYRTTTSPFADYSGLTEGVEYEWRVEAVVAGCRTVVSACQRFTVGRACGSAVTPSITSPANGMVVGSPITFAWTGTGVEGSVYTVFASLDGGPSTNIGTTTSLSLVASLGDGSVRWFVVAAAPGCAQLQSQSGNFNVCNTPAAPVARVIGQATSGQGYEVAWTGQTDAEYEIQEADNAAFINATTTVTNQTSKAFRHTTNTFAAAYHYRVRMKTPCAQVFGPYSIPVRVVIIPLPPRSQRNQGVNVPAGSKEVVVQEVFIPGEPGGGFITFTASVDKPWMTVRPQSGILPPDGVTLEVIADPANLPNGTFTGTVIVVINNPSTARAQGNGTTTRSVPVSVSLVTPVSPTGQELPPDNALIIPSVGHLDGLNSHWQSDIRVSNTGDIPMQYELRFLPAGADPNTGNKETTITVEPGATTALDDIVRNWYGIGSLGDSANGILVIKPITTAPMMALDDKPSVSLVTVASSRTYNVTTNGTLGQYIPAIPFSSFIGRAQDGNAFAQALSLQQVAQNSSFRTNLGVVEASGKGASVMLSIFDSAGVKLGDVPVELAGGEQKQLNGFLSQHGINNLADGRIEVRVTGGDGRVTAYASVVDGATNDPLLVSGVPLGAAGASRYVLPGVADLNVGIASWRTDMRVFNGGTSTQPATITFYPQDDSAPRTADVSIAPGEVKTMDNFLQSTFGLTNDGGAVHVTTPGNSNLVVSGRTYNKTDNGTYGQFVPAVTEAESVGSGDRALQIQQVEDSVRFRTNIGIAEVTGKEVTVVIEVNDPDSRVVPKIEMTLPPNSFRQLPIIRDLGLGNVYNARIAVRVIGGEGRVTAYGSVIDQVTQDPTYVPAQ